MVYSVEISQKNLIWKSSLDETEYNQFLSYLDKSSAVVNFMTAALVPVRTSNFSSFIKDFICPTLINRALSVKGIALKLLALLGAFFFDLITFPIRLLSFIPRILTNALKAKHPIHLFLIQKREAPELVKAEYATVRLSQITLEGSATDPLENCQIEVAEQTDKVTYATLNFVEMPYYEGAIKKGSISYIKEIV